MYYVMNEFVTVMYIQQNVFEKTLIEVCILHLYASFGSFCVQIGQLFETQWVFEECLNMDKSLVLKENVVDVGIEKPHPEMLWVIFVFA